MRKEAPFSMCRVFFQAIAQPVFDRSAQQRKWPPVQPCGRLRASPAWAAISFSAVSLGLGSFRLSQATALATTQDIRVQG